MSNAKKCDICGKLYEKYNGNKGDNGYNTIELTRVSFEGHIANFDTMDCCPNCMNAILDLIESLDPEKEEPHEETEGLTAYKIVCDPFKDDYIAYINNGYFVKVEPDLKSSEGQFGPDWKFTALIGDNIVPIIYTSDCEFTTNA